MHLNGHLRYVWHTFRRPKVFIFIMIGVGVIFLTFLTDNNALEIAIAGIASVFIGIGVNNYTSQEMHHGSLVIARKQQQHIVQVILLLQSKINAASLEPDTRISLSRRDIDEVNKLLTLLEQMLSN